MHSVKRSLSSCIISPVVFGAMLPSFFYAMDDAPKRVPFEEKMLTDCNSSDAVVLGKLEYIAKCYGWNESVISLTSFYAKTLKRLRIMELKAAYSRSMKDQTLQQIEMMNKTMEQWEQDDKQFFELLEEPESPKSKQSTRQKSSSLRELRTLQSSPNSDCSSKPKPRIKVTKRERNKDKEKF
jgi:hypothetical protein